MPGDDRFVEIQQSPRRPWRWWQITLLTVLALGIIGVSLLLLPKLFEGDMTPQFSAAGIASCVVALLGTTGGYLAQKRTGAGIPFVTGTAVQYATSGYASNTPARMKFSLYLRVEKV